LPYTIARPFNCVGIARSARCEMWTCTAQREAGDVACGSRPGAEGAQGTRSAAYSRRRQPGAPLHLWGSLARGIRACIEHPNALNQDFNLSTAVRTTVLELAQIIWDKVHKGAKPFRVVHDPAYEYDVQERSPAVDKAERLLGYRAETPLSTILDEVIPWIEEQITVDRSSVPASAALHQS